MAVEGNPEDNAAGGGSHENPPARGNVGLADGTPQGGATPDGEVPSVVYLIDPKPAIAPLTTHVDPSSKEGLYHWGKTTKASADWQYPAPGPESTVLYQDAIRNFAESNNLCIFKVATAGDGTIASDTKIIAGKEQANYNISSYVDILDN